MLNNKREERDLDHFNDSKEFTEYSNDVDEFRKILKDTILTKTVFDCIFAYMIADMLSNKTLIKFYLNYLSEVEK